MSLPATPVFPKQCPNTTVYNDEVRGRAFFAGYYANTPSIISQDNHNTVYYENVAATGKEVVTDLLSRDRYKPGGLKTAFKSLAEIHKAHADTRSASGGTVKFYLDRRQRLDVEELQTAYADFCHRFKSVRVNGIEVRTNTRLMSEVSGKISETALSLCAPSQGDYHERNIFSDGCIVDFEAAGWNAVSTDIATFVWHTLFVGNYFGPKYAAWSTEADKQMLDALVPRAFTYHSGEVDLRHNASRLAIINDYLRYYLDKIDWPPEETSQASYATAFRLLSMFEPHKMEATDRDIVFCLANVFAANPLDFRETINALTKAR